MDIVVTARHTEVPERFRRHLEEKLSKVGQLVPRAQRLEIAITHEANPRQAQTSERVEITVRAKGPVIRAEACADDPYAALDLAQEKLLERLRRVRDRKKVHHGRHKPTTIREGSRADAAAMNGGPAAGSSAETAVQDDGGLGESPVVIREKRHVAPPMTLDDALYEMELVGHDFYLFIDSASMAPSVVYRRRGWSYGVIRLVPDEDAEAADQADEARAALLSG
ncbi:MAG: ribosome hibernation-promoting factor, HPF/YfiA family [Actinomycetes bacterium]